MWGRSTCSTVGWGEYAPGAGCSRGLEDGNFLTVSMLSGSKSLCCAVEKIFDFSRLTS